MSGHVARHGPGEPVGADLFEHSAVDLVFFFFQAEDGIRDGRVNGVQTCALPIYKLSGGFTWEKQNNTSNPSAWPGGFSGRADREPSVFTSSLVSTLSSSVVNEIRWGLRHNISGNTQPCDLDELRDKVYAYEPNVNGFPVLDRPVTF